MLQLRRSTQHTDDALATEFVVDDDANSSQIFAGASYFPNMTISSYSISRDRTEHRPTRIASFCHYTPTALKLFRRIILRIYNYS